MAISQISLSSISRNAKSFREFCFARNCEIVRKHGLVWFKFDKGSFYAADIFHICHPWVDKKGEKVLKIKEKLAMAYVYFFHGSAATAHFCTASKSCVFWQFLYFTRVKSVSFLQIISIMKNRVISFSSSNYYTVVNEAFYVQFSWKHIKVAKGWKCIIAFGDDKNSICASKFTQE